MFRIAPQLDHQGQPMQRYIALHKALQELPEIFIGDYRVWQDRPLFNMELHERWSRMFIHPDKYTCTVECWPDHPDMSGGYEINGIAHQAWRNINGLLIHFTNESIYDGKYHALDCIRKYFENDDRNRLNRFINVYAPVAAIWFIHCSPKIYKACQNQEYLDRIPGGKLWKGIPGYNIPRWEFWRSRSEVLSTHPLAIEETRQACKAAVDGMDAVTKASWFIAYHRCYWNLLPNLANIMNNVKWISPP